MVMRPNSSTPVRKWRQQLAQIVAALGVVVVLAGCTAGGDMQITSGSAASPEPTVSAPTVVPTPEPAATVPPPTAAALEPTPAAVVPTATAVPPTATAVPDEDPLGDLLSYGTAATAAITDPLAALSLDFAAQAGDIVDVTVEPLDADLDVVVDLIDATGQSMLRAEVDESFGAEFINDVVLAQSATYSVEVSSYDEVSTGEFSVTVDLVAAAPDEELFVVGETRSIPVTAEPVAQAVFLARQGDWIDLTLVPNDEIDVVVDLVDAQGFSLFPDGPLDRSFTTEFVRVLEIRSSGYYTVVVSGYEGATGSAELTIEASNGGLPGSAVFGAEVFDPDDTAHSYPFDGPAGDVVSLIIDSIDDDLDVTVRVRQRATDQIVAEVDDRTRHEELKFEIPETGAYWFDVVENDGLLGEYAFILVAPETTIVELADGDFVLGHFSDDQPITYVVGTDNARTLTVYATAYDNTDVVLVLYDENGDVLAQVDDTTRGNEEVLMYDIEADVDYFIEVSSFFGGGTFELSIEVL